ncbi:unnamed protein product [Gongylonema pulchrum]|uniref:Uncharacterized protein n=1 Tax=Gongylonema pulchrum TaxID=637853 RepID=A0A183D602_9BILA|nr:unnamed protein product [Gongylonema pulchrum]
MGTSESGPLLVQDGDSDSCTASEFSLGTAVEDEGFELFSQSVTSGDTNKSLLTSSSFSPYRRSVSPDTMLQGASSTSSLTVSLAFVPLAKKFLTFIFVIYGRRAEKLYDLARK